MTFSKLQSALATILFTTFLPTIFLYPSISRAASVERIETSARVEKLVGELTLEEKVTLLGGTGFATHPIERLNIPALEMTDGPVGVRFGHGTTAWPAAIALASTFNPELIGAMARDLGEEARSQNKRLLLGPTVNITRTPWGGRVFESYGEDPWLTSELARAFVAGVQSQGVGTSIKHFAVNNQEWGRGHVDVHVSERALREIYWPAFETAVDAGTLSVMAAYNKVNGAYCSENSHLLQDVLKRDFGFKGFVVSDWGATHSTMSAAVNGLDLEMPNALYFNWNLVAAVQQSLLPISVIDDKIRRILTAIEHLGLLDEKLNSSRANEFEKHHPDAALKIAQESIVLLKNNGALLPLSTKKRISVAILGPSATRARTGGGGSSFVHNPAAVSAVEGLRQRIQESAANANIDLQIDDNMNLPGDGVHESKIITEPFHGEFFNNPELAGGPVFSEDTLKIEYDWEWGSPNKSINNERGYSARWTTGLAPRESGDHEFRIAFTQAARVYLDDVLIYNHWTVDDSQSPLIYETIHAKLEAGHSYRLRIEYFKLEGLASLQLEILEPSQSIESLVVRTLADAKALASQSDYVLLFVGQSAKTESESFDRLSMRLSSEQEALILKAAQNNPKTIVVVQAGSPIDMTAWASKVGAIVYAWYPGEQGGLAIADILLGNVNPSGRLPISFNKTWESSPAAVTYPGVNGVTTYTDDVFVGYRFFDLAPTQAAYRFGYGLSYTSFSSQILNVNVNDADVQNPSVDVKARIKNTGSRSGAYVAQLYVGERNPILPRPLRELKGIQKVQLAPGQSIDVTFHLDARAFHHFDQIRSVWVVTPGQYQISLLSEEAVPVDSAELLLTGSR